MIFVSKKSAVKDAVRYEQKNKHGLQVYRESEIVFLGERMQINLSIKILVTPKHKVLKVSLFSSNNLINCWLWKTFHKAQKVGKILLFQSNGK